MAKKKNPLSDTSRKKRSYVGDFDDLMADISEGENEGSAEITTAEEHAGGEEGPSADGTATHAMERSSESSDGSRDPEQAAVKVTPDASENEESGTEKPKKPLNLKIDESLHTRFKGVVGMQGRTMTEVLEEFMRAYVRKSLEDLDL